MLELIFSCSHRFSRLQRTRKSVAMSKKYWVVDVNFYGYNFTQNLRNIDFPGEMPTLSFRTNFLPNSGKVWKILGTDFPQSPKNCQKWLFSHKYAVFEKAAKNLKKRSHVTFLTFFTPNFVPSFGKILGAVSEIIRHKLTDRQKD